MAFSTSLLVLATVCCFVVNAAEEKLLPVPSGTSHRQSRQMFVIMPPPSFNYFNPYGSQMTVPAAQGQIHSESLSSGASESQIEERQNVGPEITLSPSATACIAAATTSSNCILASSAPRGSLTVTFTADKQTVALSIGPSKYYFTRVKITCDTLTNVNVFTKSSQLTATGTKEATEDKPIVLIATSTGATGSLKCKWTPL
ncbi:hypothetical protein DAPPUDRAFT_221846 [Daphnia pulex]|uniref:Uncharacterized protein n=1 Tax=Daphnia pulex TaxID=6669 RepID=E9FZZ0_DAPPU|nr:hypothetical protein DAPPUDRAFT_221846 [Daphnia pulex]|eukprot:EFX87131.1 hypothetical protein DAPPUDRAFT_221846 [Daphnia pulex]